MRVESYRVKAMPTRAPLTAPRVPSDFTRQFALLRKDGAGLCAYLRLIPPEQCVTIFSPEVPSEVLEALAKAVAQHSAVEDAVWWSEWLQGLSKSGRFDMTILMLDQNAKKSLAEMFDALATNMGSVEGSGEAAAKQLAKVRKLYS